MVRYNSRSVDPIHKNHCILVVSLARVKHCTVMID